MRDAKLGDVFEAEHVKDDAKIPAVIWEGRNYGLATPVRLRLSELRGFGMWIRGNGSYGKVKLIPTSAKASWGRQRFRPRGRSGWRTALRADCRCA